MMPITMQTIGMRGHNEILLIYTKVRRPVISRRPIKGMKTKETAMPIVRVLSETTIGHFDSKEKPCEEKSGVERQGLTLHTNG